jgi:hypothetical protein
MDPDQREPMLARLRRRLSYANVVATLALFIALGGSSYAALTITGQNVRDGSLTGKDIKRNSLTGRQIKEGRLDTVPRARNSARLGGLSAQRLLLKCPQGTIPAADVCVETQARPPASYTTAVLECGSTDSTRTPGRRLPTHNELRYAFTFDQLGPIASGGELTSEVYPSSTQAGSLDVLYVTDEAGGAGLVPNNQATPKALRCVANPLN